MSTFTGLASTEGAVVNQGPSSFLVVTSHVDYRDLPFPETTPRLVKFSAGEHRLTDAMKIRLGSSRYYREYEGNTAGVADPEEGRLEFTGPLNEILNVIAQQDNGTRWAEWHGNPSTAPQGSVTMRRPDFLMFCTSVMPEGYGFRNLRKQFPDYDSATLISDPSSFAMQLGKDFGEKFNQEDFQQDGFDRVKQLLLNQVRITAQGLPIQKELHGMITVRHGPVVYCDPPRKVVDRFPRAERRAVRPFVKSHEFAEQREYRFVVEPIGEPKETDFLMEITDELRSLTVSLGIDPCPSPTS